MALTICFSDVAVVMWLVCFATGYGTTSAKLFMSRCYGVTKVKP